MTHKEPANNYEAVYNYDRAMFREGNLEEMLARTALSLDVSGKYILVPTLNQTYRVDCETGHVYHGDDLTLPSNTERLFILHHLNYSSEDAGLSGVEIPFHAIRGVSHFMQAFQRETVPPLQETFGGRLPLFLEVGQQLGGTVRDLGEASVTLHMLPLIPITYILWDGDDEFPVGVQILFDEHITKCTHGEDVPVLGTFGAATLVAAAKKKLDV